MKEGRVTFAAFALIVHLAVPYAASAMYRSDSCGEAEATPADDLKIVTGIDSKRAWLTAKYGGLHIRKFTQRGGTSVVEFRHKDDVVVLSLAEGNMTVSRKGVTQALGTVEAMNKVQELLGGSAAMFHARGMLARLEGSSKLDAPEMSLLSATAFAATLTGDAGAPLRLSDHFMAVHHGIFRPVRIAFSCWSKYSSETMGAWIDYESCVTEAESSWFSYARGQACAATWFLRSESAWFEYIGCLSPLAMAPSED